MVVATDLERRFRDMSDAQLRSLVVNRAARFARLHEVDAPLPLLVDAEALVAQATLELVQRKRDRVDAAGS